MSRGGLLVVLVVLAILYPPVALLMERGPVAAFQFFATDAFTYLAVARHSQGNNFFTFDGTHPINGFHPLWQWTLSGLAALGDPDDQEFLLMGAFLLGLALATAGLACFALAVLDLTGSFAAALLAAVPGWYYLGFALLEPQFGSSWSFVNGMESPLSICLFGILILFLVRCDVFGRAGRGRLLLLSCLLTLLTLARLDDGFLLLPPLVLILLTSAWAGRRGEGLLVFLAVPVAVLGAFLAYNQIRAGSLLPLSGLVKGGLGLWENLRCLVYTLLPNPVIRSETGFAWKEIAYRTVQLWAPMVVAALWLARPAAGGGQGGQVVSGAVDSPDATPAEPGWLPVRWVADPDSRLLFVLSGYVLLKGLYNLVNVLMVHTGPWYFAGSILVFNLLAARALAPVLVPVERGRPAGERPSPLAAAAGGATPPACTREGGPGALGLGLAVVALVLVQANGFGRLKWNTDYNHHLYRFWANREAITAGLTAAVPGSGVLEFDDGIFSFSLGVPVLHGFCFAGDRDLFAARGRGELFKLAWERGFRVFATLAYLTRPLPSTLDQATLDAICRNEFQRSGERSGPWRFTVAWRDPVTQVTFIRFDPASGN
ncbi:MAG: hypothetical protein GX442_25110 [Candidatus Riflebacteria bacterium]|nr:hypothetical protein [Candidatus Riflebacteria bacterium]